MTDVADFLNFYVVKARPLLLKERTDDALFPSADPWEDMGEVCSLYDVPRLTPTLLRKAASTAAYSSLSELDRKRVANHMTHRPETAYKAYAAKKRRSDAAQSVQQMKTVMYGEGAAAEDSMQLVSCSQDCANTVPSSAGALNRQQRWTPKPFSASEQTAVEKEARRLCHTGAHVTTPRVLSIMSRYKPLFDERSPRAVEEQLKSALSKMSSQRSSAFEFTNRSEARRRRGASARRK